MGALAKLFKSSKPDEERWEIPSAYQPVPRDTKIKILKPCSGASDGIRVEHFEANQVHTVSQQLARLLVETGAAEKI